VEELESRLQPSFLLGGLDLDADPGDDLFADHHRDQDSLASLASALATPPSTPVSSSGLSLASNAGGGGSPTAPGSGPQTVSPPAAELNALSAAARLPGWNSTTSPHLSVGPAPAPVPVTLASVTGVQSPVVQGSLSGTWLGSNGGDPTPPSVVWAGYQGDPVHGQWNAVVAGSGASAGYLFLGGTSTDASRGITVATVEKLRSDGSTDASTYVIRFEPTFGAYRESDAVQHLALTPDGGTLYATANISTSTAFGFSGIVAAIDATAPQAFFTGFADSKFNGVAVSGTASSYSVLVSGAVPSATQPNGTDLLLASFTSTLATWNYGLVYAFTQRSAVGLSTSGDSAGNQYFSGTFTSPTDTLGLFGKIDPMGNVVWNFVFANVTPGPGGAINGVVESGGFLYGTGTLNDTNGVSGPLHQDLVEFKADDATGSISSGGYGFLWVNQSGSGRTGDLAGEGLAVRNGDAYAVGFNFDSSAPPGPDRESAIVLHFGPTGATVAGIGELGGSGFDNAYGLDFATASGTDIFWAGGTTSTDLPVTDGSVYGGGLTDGWASRWIV
jgi:hypothetical protein